MNTNISDLNNQAHTRLNCASVKLCASALYILLSLSNTGVCMCERISTCPACQTLGRWVWTHC